MVHLLVAKSEGLQRFSPTIGIDVPISCCYYEGVMACIV